MLAARGQRVIEALDPTTKHISVGDRVAIKDSGIAHIDLLLTSETYIEQAALVTGVNELFTRDEMRKNNYPQKLSEVRLAFLRYLLKIDAGRVTIPQSKLYDQITMARRQIERLTTQRRVMSSPAARS